ncbi:MAG: STAS domain-containing protein [bacterium]|nr:STAS domain-containing protein [bacterium]
MTDHVAGEGFGAGVMSDCYQIELPQPITTGSAVVRIGRKLDHEEGQRICREIRRKIQEGYHGWEIDLADLEACDSVTMGICVMMHATIKRYGGKSLFKVAQKSQVDKLMMLSKLQQVLSIQFIEKK